MQRIASYLLSVLVCVTLAATLGMSQVPTGTLAGTVTDASGAVVPKAAVTLTNKETGAVRQVETNAEGFFAAPALAAGEYDLKVVAKGFSTSLRAVQVATGSTTTVNVGLQVGQTTEIVTVTGGTAATINYESNTVQGVVTRQQIDNLPLNGRSFLNLAVLEPGVTVVAGNPAQFNAQFNVSVLGGPASHTAITVDGGNVRNPVEGGTGQNFSQEVVQEFQLSSTNFDLSTGITAFGSINIVTRGGSNDFHGAAYFYFRDHNLGAYPGLARNSFTNDPFFARRQSGFVFSGPLKKDKLHFFTNFEYTNQAGVYIVQPDLPSVAGFGTLAPAPYRGKQFSGRVDYRYNDKHSMFIRYSHDGNTNSGPFGTPVPPSNFVSNRNWVDQYLLSVTSVVSDKLVNDFRFSFQYWQNRNIPAPCAGDASANCIGTGGPEVFYLNSVNFALGNNFNSPQGRDLRRFPVSDNVTWQLGKHRLKFGGEWEHFDGTGYWGFFDPARVYLLSPEFIKGVGVPPEVFGLPACPTVATCGKLSAASFRLLPVVTFILGIGDRAQPSYKLENARGNNRFHFYAQDTWKLSPKLTLNYGLGWEHETNVLNHDLAKPSYITPLYGSDLSATQRNYKNFTPAVGFAWSFGKNHATVVRGGAGIFYDTQLGWWRLGERAVIGGSGRQFILNTSVTNPRTGQPFSTAFLNSLGYNYGTFLTDLPALRAQQEAKYPGKGDAPQILLSKQANALGALYPRDFPTTQAQHFNIGFQRELKGGLVAQADFVYRHMIHGTPGSFFGASVDYNRFDSIAGPVIPRCTTTAQANDPTARCSSGPINFWWPGATSKYKALLVKVDKRFSHRYQLTTSYALQDSQSVLDVTYDLNNFFGSYGHDLARHNLTVSGTVDLPWRVRLSLLSTFVSHPPVVPVISGFDPTGTHANSGGGYAPLPGLGFDGFLNKKALEAFVSRYNGSLAGQLTPAAVAGLLPGQKYPTITLPANYKLGDVFTSQDLRVEKTVRFKEKVDLRLIGEAFNLFNVSNLTNFNFNLASPATFGQANQRVGQTFGSGGPRAFQFAARLSF